MYSWIKPALIVLLFIVSEQRRKLLHSSDRSSSRIRYIFITNGTVLVLPAWLGLVCDLCFHDLCCTAACQNENRCLTWASEYGNQSLANIFDCFFFRLSCRESRMRRKRSCASWNISIQQVPFYPHIKNKATRRKSPLRYRAGFHTRAPAPEPRRFSSFCQSCLIEFI